MIGVARRFGRLKLELRLGAAVIQLTATNRQTTGQTDMASGTKIADIGGVPTGVTPTLTPSDGRFVIAGDAGSGWKVVRGMSAISAGTIALTVAATGAASVSFSIEITQAATAPAAFTARQAPARQSVSGSGWNVADVGGDIYSVEATLSNGGIGIQTYLGLDSTGQNGFVIEHNPQFDSGTGRMWIKYFTNGSTAGAISGQTNFVAVTRGSVGSVLRYEYDGVAGKISAYQDNVLLLTANVPIATPAGRRVRQTYDSSGLTSITYGANAPPVTITGKTINTSTGKVILDLSYYMPVADTYQIQIEEVVSGNVLVAWEDGVIQSNPSAGTGSIMSASVVPIGKKGAVVRARVRQKTVNASTTSSTVLYPQQLVFGQNISALTNVFRPMRTYSNMMQQGYWQKSSGDYASVYRSGADGYLDAMGWPLKPNLYYWYPLPDAEGVEATTVLEWDGGPMTIRHIHTAGGNGIGAIGAIQSPNANKRTWTITANRESGTNHELCGRFEITALDTANPPKNIRMYHLGDDTSQRFLPSFIDFMKLLPGRVRFMDDTGVNVEDTINYNTPQVWANRPLQDNGSQMKSAPFEDLIEVCNRSNRPITLNLHGAFAFEDGGLDYADKLFDLMYYGTGAVFITAGYSAPNGVNKTIVLECGNENWNPGFGGHGHYHYLAKTGVRLGLYPQYTNGTEEYAVALGMRRRLQYTLMERMKARIPGWRARTVMLINGQFVSSDDVAKMYGGTDASRVDACHDEWAWGPYIPTDPNAGGQSQNVPDKSPAGICAFLKSWAETVTKPTLDARAVDVAGKGKSFGVYEVNAALIALGLTIQQIKDLCKSDDWYLLWKNTFIPMAVGFGGDWSLYGDVGHMFVGEMWSLLHIVGSTYNRAWDAVLEWQQANMPA